MTRSRRPHRRATALIALLGLTALPASATATEGNLYRYGPSVWGVSSPFSASWQGTAMMVQAPEVASIATGNRWEMNWGCPVAGSEVSHVAFGGLRTAAASSLEVRVTGNRQTLWAIPDVQLPQSPAGGRQYVVALPGGHCNVHLALAQVENRAQHKRTWFIDSPGVYVRDLTAPGVGIRHVSSGWFNATPRSLVVGWSTGDNFGSDGVGLQQIHVGGHRVWAGSPGVGDHEIAADISSIGDGTHQLSVQAAGDGTAAGAATAAVRIDRTAPATGTAAPRHPGTPRVVALSWSAHDATSGVATSRAEIAHGGGWVTLAEAGAGQAAPAVAVPAGVPDGVHAWRVSATDHAGNARTVAGQGSIVVDTTPPSLSGDVPGGWARTAALRARIDDNLADEIGLGDIEVDINTAADGRDTGNWVRVLTTRPQPGESILPLDLAGLGDGIHLVRARARNGGPFGASLSSEQTLALRIDRTGPSVTGATFTPAQGGLLRASWSAEDAHSGVARAVVQRADGDQWRTLGQGDAAGGAGSLVVDASTLGAGRHRVRSVAVDAAGNSGVAEGVATVPEEAATGGGATARPGGGETAGQPGFGSGAADPWARLRSARLHLAVPGARATPARGGRSVLVRTTSVGRPVIVRGRLLDAGGRPVAGAEIEARGHRGVVMARGRTSRTGAVRLRLRPEAGGAIRVGVPAGGTLLPARAARDVRLRVRARVVLRRMHASVRTGDTVLFAGRVYPAPARLGMAGRKGVVLEWRDPLRGVWRPVVNARVRPNGTFSVPWRFALRGVAVPLRARVPAEIGWPLLPAVSPRMVVTPR
jgi:hypothetical protein